MAVLKRLLPFLLVFAVWAGVYLPGLGSLEIRGEEGRRILPAIAMLETGNWLVPHIGEVPYLKKPPMVNWLVAASFAVTGQRHEWAARLPSALAVLALAVGVLWALRQRLGVDHALFAALAVLTTVEIVDKGRLIEIDALYTAAFGLSLAAWIGLARRSERSRWVVPGVFLGIGLLLKGPLLLLFFYAVVVIVLARSGKLSALWSPQHLTGAAVMLAIFFAWLVPHLLSAEAKNAVETWSGQYAERLDWGDYRPANTLLNFGRAVFNFLPWVLVVPFGRNRRLEDQALLSGLEWGTLGTFLALILLPGGLPRYTLPLAAPVAILAAYRLQQSARLTTIAIRCVSVGLLLIVLAGFWVLFAPSGRLYVIPAAMLALGASIWLHFEDTPRIRTLNWTLGALAVSATLFYCGKILPVLQRRESLRPEAAKIRSLAPDGEVIYAVGLDTPHLLYYLRPPHRLEPDVGAVPAGAEYLLVGRDEVGRVKQHFGSRAAELLRYTERGNNQTFLFRVR
ncbi:MAG: glycosyltransferase family 39 protein [Verrucomicrobia bacterium]|nr:glycosyltransferase family 39 protein [Verrucomicrobiota bacterium]